MTIYKECAGSRLYWNWRESEYLAQMHRFPLPCFYPHIKQPGDACVTAAIDLAALRHRRKHLRTMHQRRPDMYGLLTQEVKMWQEYPEIPWDYPECADLVNRAQL